MGLLRSKVPFFTISFYWTIYNLTETSSVPSKQEQYWGNCLLHSLPRRITTDAKYSRSIMHPTVRRKNACLKAIRNVSREPLGSLWWFCPLNSQTVSNQHDVAEIFFIIFSNRSLCPLFILITRRNLDTEICFLPRTVPLHHPCTSSC